MREVVSSLVFKRDNILKFITDSENKRSELKEKVNSEETPANSYKFLEDLEIKDKIKHCKTTSFIKVCWYFNRGYCKKKEYCKYKHETRECSF